MAGLVEKTYGDALFELFLEEDPSKLTEAKEELSAVNSIISELPELIKLEDTDDRKGRKTRYNQRSL